MPRKAKKNAEPSEPQISKTSDETKLKTTSEAGLDRTLDREADARMKAVSPASSSGELEQLAEAADTFEQAYDDVSLAKGEGTAPASGDAPEPKAVEIEELTDGLGEEVEPGDEQTREAPPVRLERLHKILSQAGIASRRHAEAMITEGRVQVNGQVVTELGSKADLGRDHIKVDGKLIHGVERLRYFVLNKPKGYVTTVSDPEGRPTVMQFFRKTGERLYPVGRLDYQSEGLLLVTNDGDLANKLTKAATGVEKTYLVKVSGQPTEEELDRLRAGVGIDRGRAGEGRVHTAPAIIREARAGDNPWYEVVLTEGRNRELRKMFEEIGHHVEKIRRVGYGPLVLDVEPGQFRELEPGELAKLRLAAEGKWRKPKPRQTEQRKQTPRPEKRSAPPREDRRFAGEFAGRTRTREDQHRTDRRKPRFERPAEPRHEGVGRGEAAGRGTGRGLTPRDEGTRYADVRKPPQRKPGVQGQKWNREGGAPRPYQRPFAGGVRKQSSDERAGFDASKTGGRKPERGGPRTAFSRPAKPGEQKGRGQAREKGQGPSRGWQAQRGPSRFGESEVADRRKERGESGPPQRRSGPPRSSRPAGPPARPGARGAAGGARGSGRRPTGRGPAGPGRGDRGRGR